MSTAKERATGMNYVAVRQSLLRLPMIIGGSSEPTPPTVIVKGGHEVCIGNFYEHGLEVDDLLMDEVTRIGSMTDEHLMPGMPSSGGYVEYILVPTNEYYVIYVTLKLDEWAIGESDPAEVPILWMKRSPDLEAETHEEADGDDWKYYYPVFNMLQAHFDHLFSHATTMEDVYQEFDGLLVNNAIGMIQMDIMLNRG